MPSMSHSGHVWHGTLCTYQGHGLASQCLTIPWHGSHLSTLCSWPGMQSARQAGGSARVASKGTSWLSGCKAWLGAVSCCSPSSGKLPLPAAAVPVWDRGTTAVQSRNGATSGGRDWAGPVRQLPDWRGRAWLPPSHLYQGACTRQLGPGGHAVRTRLRGEWQFFFGGGVTALLSWPSYGPVSVSWRSVVIKGDLCYWQLY